MDSPLACRRCADGKGCGAGIFQAAEKPREIEILIPAGMSVSPGDSIALTIGPKFLLRAAMLAYGLPLAGMVLFAGIGWWMPDSMSDSAAVVLAITGLAVGLAVGRQILQRESVCAQFVPTIGRTGGV